MEDQEQLYIKGFNNGYLLSKHDPELLKQILKNDNSGQYSQGLQEGMKQHETEMLLAKLNKPHDKKMKQ